MRNRIKNIISATIFISIFLISYTLIKKNTLRPSLKCDCLIAGINEETYPYANKDEKRFKGYEIDLLTELSKRMTKKISFVILSKKEIENALKQGSIHIAYSHCVEQKNKSSIIDISDKYNELKTFINNTIEELYEDGTIDDLCQKWKLKNNT